MDTKYKKMADWKAYAHIYNGQPRRVNMQCQSNQYCAATTKTNQKWTVDYDATDQDTEQHCKESRENMQSLYKKNTKRNTNVAKVSIITKTSEYGG